MKDQLLDTGEAAKVLGISSATFFRHLAKRAFPFLRTRFDEEHPKGQLYFSKIRLKDTSWNKEYSMEREEMKKDEAAERKLALKIIILTIEMYEALSKLQEEDLPDDERDEREDDLELKQREVAKYNTEIYEFQRRRVKDFFGKDNAVLFFKDLFVDEHEKLRRAQKVTQEYNQHGGVILNEDAIEAKKLGEEAEAKLARRRFAEQEKEREQARKKG